MAVGGLVVLDAEALAGHLFKAGSVFGFLAAHRRELFPDEMSADLSPSGRSHPSVAADVMAAVITVQALHGLSDSETVDAVTFDHWLHHRAAAINLRRLITLGLERTGTIWAIA